jgi:hypothetical protein
MKIRKLALFTCQRDDAGMFDPLSAQDRTLRLAKDVNDFPFKDTLINEPGARCRRRRVRRSATQLPPGWGNRHRQG